MRLSVIIPTLNEAACLAQGIAVLRDRTSRYPVEVIVADCGSVDDTQGVATRCGAKLVTHPSLTNRASACNAGVGASSGDVLLFLHADCLVPARYDQHIRDALASAGVVGGAFVFKLDGPQRRLRFVEWVNHIRYGVRQRFFGDQGIFVRRTSFEKIGGFPPRNLLEDAHFCASLRRIGSLRLVRANMLTSARRFLRGGILRTLAFDAWIVLHDLVGLNAERFAGRYAEDNIRRGQNAADPQPLIAASLSELPA